MENKSYDAIVIGGGPGGYVAAIRLGQLKQKTLVVEKAHMGGVCLNWGCIPSKALISATKLVSSMRHAEAIGIVAKDLSVDVKKMQEWKNGIVKKLTGGVQSLVKGSGADIIFGTATLKGNKLVEVKDPEGKTTIYEAKKGIVVATGAHPIQLPGFAIDGKTVITAEHAVSLNEVPKTLVLIGGGVIGLELGMVYQTLGAKVIVVEMMEQLLPGVDPDLVKVVEQQFIKNGGEVFYGAKAKECKVKAGKAVVSIEHGGSTKTLEADKVLVAVGFRPNTEGLGLENAGVTLDKRGHISVNARLESNVAGVFAIGDVAGPPYLAHKASKEGEIAAEVIAGKKTIRDWRAMPAAIFTDPEIATVGLSETAAKAQNKKITLGKFPFAVSGRAMAVRETNGFIKVIVDADNGEVLGVGIVGPEASDLISEAALAIEMCAYAEDVALTVHPHPTLGEGMMEAFKHAVGEAIHVKNK
ncbi:MAG: dihydrolipoyl dehydrogenase [Myxococcales bacterium]|nr:dihydrolipoyl dehydrogenase [Myxococcales bacterium]